jgi:DnaJ-domain-containing protein 1
MNQKLHDEYEAAWRAEAAASAAYRAAQDALRKLERERNDATDRLRRAYAALVGNKQEEG